MNIKRQNGYLTLDSLSNIELYYTTPNNITNENITIEGEEYKHIVNVMRHSVDDIIHITNGIGSIFSARIIEINKKDIISKITEEYKYKKRYPGIIFCIPKLRISDRFEFALEKCTELGVTEFIVINTMRTVSKGEKIERWEKIVLSAMKQSLRAYLPEISVASLNEIKNNSGAKIVFEQGGNKKLSEVNTTPTEPIYFIFGPEGGLAKEEIDLFKDNIYSLSQNRLRTETAIVTVAALLSGK
jgi:16S rRNA (uracil1498-N3)-methyltransferase